MTPPSAPLDGPDLPWERLVALLFGAMGQRAPTPQDVAQVAGPDPEGNMLRFLAHGGWGIGGPGMAQILGAIPPGPARRGAFLAASLPGAPDADPPYHLARAAGLLCGALAEEAALWLPDPPAALVAPDSAPALVRARGLLGAALDRALAGRPDAPRRQLEVQALLARPDRRAQTAEVVDSALEMLADVEEIEPDFAPAARALANWGRAAWAHLDGIATMRALFAALPPPPTPGLDATRAAAHAFLAADPHLREGWEVQRFGLHGATGTLTGRAWVEGLGLLCRAEAGADTSAALQALVDAQPPGPLRWYEGWDRIPPDIDSLGLFLRIAARLGLPRARVAPWLAPLHASTTPGTPTPTWLVRGPDGPTVAPEAPTWAGDTCPAVRLLWVLGAATWDPEELAERIETDLLDVIPGIEAGGDPRLVHYGAPVAEGSLLEVAALLADRALPDRLAGPLARAAAAVAARLLATQRLDGGWGSPLATALVLPGLRALGAPAVALDRATRYLGEAQHPDGSWHPEELFVVPGKPPVLVARHASRALTTALVLRGLGAATDA